MIKGIVAVDRNWAIGKVNKETGVGQLLFNIPADLKYFKEKTNHTVVVMGKATYDSLPKKPLPNRVNVVLWDKAPSIDCLDGCITFSSFDVLLSFVKVLAKEYDVFICGGASVYGLFLPYYDEVLVTRIDAEDPDATARFPFLNWAGFKGEQISPVQFTDDSLSFSFWRYTRKASDEGAEKQGDACGFWDSAAEDAG